MLSTDYYKRYTKNDSGGICKVQYVSTKECFFQECKYDSRLENSVTYYIKIGEKSHIIISIDIYKAFHKI